MMELDLEALRAVVEDAKRKGWYSTPLSPAQVLALLDRLEAAERRLAPLNEPWWNERGRSAVDTNEARQ